MHSNGDVADAGPGVEPGAKGVERAVVREDGASGESDRCPEEPAALVEHGLLDDLVGPDKDGLRDGQLERLRGLHVDH